MYFIFAATLLLLLCLFMLGICTQYTRNSFLTVTLRNERFRDCEVIFASTLETIRVTDSQKQSLLPYQDANLPAWSSGMFAVSLQTMKKNDTIKFNRLKDVHKFNRVQCSVAFIQILQPLTPELPSNLFEVLTPRYLPIIRKDEDYFIFVTENENDMDSLLLSAGFGTKIKFKFGVVINPPPDISEISDIILKTVDLYSEDRGQAKIFTSVVNNTERSLTLTLFPDTTDNFNWKRVRVANPKAPFYFEMRPDPSNRGGNIPVRGLYKVWLDEMMTRFNFTIDLFQSSLSGGTGKRLKNGTWQGAVADVLSGRADMAIYIGHIYNRHEFVEWSAPLTYEWMVFITHKPKAYFSATAIFKPFPISLWIGFISSIMLICITIKFIAKCDCNILLRVPTRKIFLYLFASCMEQDAEYYLIVLLRIPTIRTLISFWLLFSLIISTVYRGKLVSLIAFPALNWVPTTFDELAFSGYRVGVNVLGKGGAAYSVLSTSKSPVYQNLFNKMEIYPDPAVCLKEGLSHNIGCIMWKSVADSTEAKNFTDKYGRKPFRASEQTTSFIEDGYIWEKRAVFRHHFDRLTWSMVETGLSSFWFQSDLIELKTRRLERERRIRNGMENSTDSNLYDLGSMDVGPSTLKIVNLIGLLYIYVCGLLCGLVCFLLERITTKYLLDFSKLLCVR